MPLHTQFLPFLVEVSCLFLAPLPPSLLPSLPVLADPRLPSLPVLVSAHVECRWCWVRSSLEAPSPIVLFRCPFLVVQPECLALLQALRSAAPCPPVALLVARCLHRVMQIAGELFLEAMLAKDAGVVLAHVLTRQRQMHNADSKSQAAALAARLAAAAASACARREMGGLTSEPMPFSGSLREDNGASYHPRSSLGSSYLGSASPSPSPSPSPGSSSRSSFATATLRDDSSGVSFEMDPSPREDTRAREPHSQEGWDAPRAGVPREAQAGGPSSGGALGGENVGGAPAGAVGGGEPRPASGNSPLPEDCDEVWWPVRRTVFRVVEEYLRGSPEAQRSAALSWLFRGALFSLLEEAKARAFALPLILMLMKVRGPCS